MASSDIDAVVVADGKVVVAVLMLLFMAMRQ